ncbi:MAG TPA: tetratricopeptide repeat protein [Lacunisphaera sp.]|nr:tetratricopeptide repeat protein [Lacunisphaera sp.]
MSAPNPEPAAAPAARGRIPWLGWLLAALALALATWALFQRARYGEFLAFDDDHNITLNPNLGTLGGNMERWAFTDVTYARRYLPLGWLAFSALVTAAGFNAAWFHSTGLVLHILNGILLAGLLRHLAGRNEKARGWGTWVVAVPAVWWLWHPLRVEPVAWASSLLYIMATTWMLVAALLFCTGLDRGRAWRWLALVAYGCSLLTYGIWLGAPVALAALAWGQYSRRTPGAASAWRAVAATTWPFFLLAAAALAINLLARSEAASSWGRPVPLQAAAIGLAVLRSLATLGWFLLKMIWPVRLTPADDLWAGATIAPAALVAGLGTLALAAALAAGLVKRFGLAPLLFLAAFVVIELPMTGLTETNFLLSDRYTYAGQIVGAAALAAGLARSRARWSLPLLSVLAGLTLAGAGRAWSQVAVWHDNDALFVHVVATAQHDETRRFYRERWLGIDLGAGKLKEVEAAMANGGVAASSQGFRLMLNDARRVRTDAETSGSVTCTVAVAHHQLGRDAWRRGDLRMAQVHLERAVQLAPRDWPAWADYAALLAGMGHRTEAARILTIIPVTGPPAAVHRAVEQILRRP